MRYLEIMTAMAAATLLLAGCRERFDGKAKAATVSTVATQAELPVSATKALPEDVPLQVDVTGTLAAWEEATVSVEAEGRLIELRVDLGDRVAKGGVLARISPEVYQFRKAQAEAELMAAESDHQRLQGLAGKDMATRQQVDEAQRRLGMAQANADLAGKQLQDTTLKAPIGAMVSRRMVNLGEYVRTGNPAFVLVRIDPLKLRVDVPERYVANVKLGDPVEVFGEALTGRTLQGKVVRIGPAVSADTRSFPVEARFDNADGSVKPGTFARATIRTGTLARSVVVPESAVATFAGNPRVFVIDGGRARERPIEIAGRYQSRILVSKGVAAGETVAVSGIDLLSDGARVTIREAEKQP